MSEENNDLSILSVRESTSGHEMEQTQVATGFQAYMFEYKLDTLTRSILKMSDSLARLTRLHGALLNCEEEDALFEEGGQSEFGPAEHILSEETNAPINVFPQRERAGIQGLLTSMSCQCLGQLSNYRHKGLPRGGIIDIFG